MGKIESATLAAFLMYEMKNPESKFTHFFKLLPANFDDIPVMFSEKEKEYLAGTTIYDYITISCQKFEKIHLNLLNHIPNFSFSLSDFLYCSMAVQSRCFQLDTFAMVPFADLLNHHEEPNVKYKFDKEQNAYVLRASRDIKRGEEICHFYGERRQKFF